MYLVQSISLIDLLGALVHVFEGVGPLYRQLSGVHHGQSVLLWVQPRLLMGAVLLFPLWVVLTRLVHTPHHLEGVDQETKACIITGLLFDNEAHTAHSVSVNKTKDNAGWKLLSNS